jgi:hypothetical protein
MGSMENSQPKEEKLRGYCTVCNRYYFYRNGLDTNKLQVHQHHEGVCMGNRHHCARIKNGPAAK